MTENNNKRPREEEEEQQQQHQGEREGANGNSNKAIKLVDENVKYFRKRDGTVVQFDWKILSNYFRSLGGDDLQVDFDKIAKEVQRSLVPGQPIGFEKISDLAAKISAHYTTIHGDYQKIGGRIAVDWLNKNTPETFSECIKILYENCRYTSKFLASSKTSLKKQSSEREEKHHNPLVSKELYDILFSGPDCEAVRARIDAIVAEANKRKSEITHFGFTTLAKSYLMRKQVPQLVNRPSSNNLPRNGNKVVKTKIIQGPIMERIEYMNMRTALGIRGNDIEATIEVFHGLADRKFTHASPTLFNAGTPNPQLSSCFLVKVKGDSLEGIYDSLKDCAIISKSAGGIAITISTIRACGSPINGTNGFSSGILPMLKIYDGTAGYVDQGGQKRKGAIAIYCEPWHADFEEFINLRKSKGDMTTKCRQLNLGIWCPSLFLDLVEEDGDWYMFCPNECPGLNETYGDDFERLYYYYVKKGAYRKKMKARDLFNAIKLAQVEDGQPYMMFKDKANMKSNHKHLGVLETSNLCTEILEWVSYDEIAVCNLASLCLGSFLVKPPGVKGVWNKPSFNFTDFARCTKMLVRNMNRIIDINYYPVKEAKKSNLRHRPIGIGVQGLADVFAAMRISYDSPEAMKLNEEIFACMYYAAVSESVAIAKEEGPYPSFEGSPASKGILQPDMWKEERPEIQIVQSIEDYDSKTLTLDWDSLKNDVKTHGMRNSLLIAPMPTASTSQIMGGSETTQPYVSCMYSRVTLTGRHQVVNQCLVEELTEIGLWNEDMRQRIISEQGSVANIESIPQHIRDHHKTIFELDDECLVRMAASRGPYIDQSQSLNIFVKDPSVISRLTFLAHDLGLKGIYYWRVRPKLQRVMTTLDHKKIEITKREESMACGSASSSSPSLVCAGRTDSGYSSDGSLDLQKKKDEMNVDSQGGEPTQAVAAVMPVQHLNSEMTDDHHQLQEEDDVERERRGECIGACQL